MNIEPKAPMSECIVCGSPTIIDTEGDKKPLCTNPLCSTLNKPKNESSGYADTMESKYKEMSGLIPPDIYSKSFWSPPMQFVIPSKKTEMTPLEMWGSPQSEPNSKPTVNIETEPTVIGPDYKVLFFELAILVTAAYYGLKTIAVPGHEPYSIYNQDLEKAMTLIGSVTNSPWMAQWKPYKINTSTARKIVN